MDLRETLLAFLFVLLSVLWRKSSPRGDTLALSSGTWAFLRLLLPSAGQSWNWQALPPRSGMQKAPDWGEMVLLRLSQGLLLPLPCHVAWGTVTGLVRSWRKRPLYVGLGYLCELLTGLLWVPGPGQRRKEPDSLECGERQQEAKRRKG